ncbi:MFS transporter [Paractinoplanes ferrugineus]|uniref:MFS transporter n=1 Tax=Paractinoplanes ferrugineus TaxID=113564 RepID=A0A919J100_9ACTN|nr:MFS transporter [Actinoplanes ferrugineus]GIE12746.1 MFS transporter [Actinoplanes ferrugineus]
MVAPVASGPGVAADPAASRRIWFLLPLSAFATFTLIGGVTSVLLGRQVAMHYSDTDAAGVLGLVLAVTSIPTVVTQPIFGALSDRGRRGRPRRRNIWVLGSAFAIIPFVVATALAGNVVLITLLWCLAAFPLNAASVNLSTALPERVPAAKRATMSGLLGLSQVSGLLAGLVLGGLSSILFGYLAVGAVYVLTMILFAALAPETHHELPEPPPAPARRWGLPSFTGARDFYLAALGRFLVLFGTQVVLGFLLYTLRDYVRVGDGSLADATAALVPLSAVNGAATLLSAACSGYLADRLGRLKIFVVISSLMIVPVGLILFLSATLAAVYVCAGLLGLAFGTYLAIDQALVTAVLPSESRTGGDLGLINVASTLPNVLGPAVAGGLVALTGSFRPGFVTMMIAALLGALTVRYISDRVR